ncbi:transferase, Chloramphenicol acetyltransferase-like domain protein [Artemisia annua]|uniref:Transferase, Chloramphenicol acetyltransferase-like domain protein n=1 Tax=Artemisia annua TaxID=35608 RepID=A0A2U1QJS2_ARTAN|nr:transferase, Chloramphenicol acetyltransferase-like domain protein [Artemisia annua]
MKVEKQSSKFIKPFDPTPATYGRYRIGFIDELTPPLYVGMVLFFSPNDNHNPKSVSKLEKSLEKTLTRFYPLAGRYVDEMKTVECNDEGAEFIHAKANIKLQDFLGFEANAMLVDEFIPFKSGSAHLLSDPLLAIQVTLFECGGVAIGVSAAHKTVDASTLCTFLNGWASMNREENEIEFLGPDFNSSLLFPPRDLPSSPQPPPMTMSDDMLSKHTKMKLLFSESDISNMKAKAIASGKVSTRQLSKVQLVSAMIWKALNAIDKAIHNYPRESILLQPVNLRGKMASPISENSCGNLFGFCTTESGIYETTDRLVDGLSDSVKKIINNYSKVYHNSEEGQIMVLNSHLRLASINPLSTNVVILTSWCKFPFYETNFGFGKPIWVVPGTIAWRNSGCLIDDAQGKGVEAYVFLEVKDVPDFEQALNVDDFDS